MNKHFRALGSRLALGCLILGWALPACRSARSGDVVKVTADCEYSLGLGDPGSEPASTNIALASPLRDQCQSPVYVALGWKRDKGLSAGMVVRAFVLRDGQVGLADGVQLSDGRVMVAGQILDRAAF
jgi:hypothetical protein